MIYKAKDEEGKEKRREEAGGAGEVLIGRGSGNGGANRQTVQMGLPGKVCGLCQICNWARTVTLTDYKNLTTFTTTKKLNRQQVRWAELLGQHKFKILYTPGQDNRRADILS